MVLSSVVVAVSSALAEVSTRLVVESNALVLVSTRFNVVSSALVFVSSALVVVSTALVFVRPGVVFVSSALVVVSSVAPDGGSAGQGPKWHSLGRDRGCSGPTRSGAEPEGCCANRERDGARREGWRSRAEAAAPRGRAAVPCRRTGCSGQEGRARGPMRSRAGRHLRCSRTGGARSARARCGSAPQGQVLTP